MRIGLLLLHGGRHGVIRLLDRLVEGRCRRRVEPDDTTLIDGVPILVVEILSPSDTIEEIEEKIDLYQKFRVPLIWVIDPHDRTVTIYRLDSEPELVNITQELTGGPHLPGFRVQVAELFA